MCTRPRVRVYRQGKGVERVPQGCHELSQETEIGERGQDKGDN